MPNNKFRPHDHVPRAEFVAAFSRMLFKTSDGEYESTSKYYTHHMEKLKTEKAIDNQKNNVYFWLFKFIVLVAYLVVINVVLYGITLLNS